VQPTTTTTAPPGAVLPCQILNCSTWYLTLPTPLDGGTNPDTVHNPALTSFSNAYFHANADNTGVVFTAPVNGSTTANSQYARSELRETNADGSLASWSSTVGDNTLTVTGAATQLPVQKPQMIIGQIHGPSSLVVAIEVDGSHIIWKTDGGPFNVIDPAYTLGTRYTFQLVASGGQIRIYYDGKLAATTPYTGAGLYFKAGAYGQSNSAQGDYPPAASQAVIYGLSVAHS
jgi:hypothetical protein